MTDLISRADAIAYIDRVIKSGLGRYKSLNYIRKYISALPSADAVHGEWIDIDNYYRLATCSHCHKVTMFEKWGEYTKPYNFCPNCGARMKGGAE